MMPHQKSKPRNRKGFSPWGLMIVLLLVSAAAYFGTKHNEQPTVPEHRSIAKAEPKEKVLPAPVPESSPEPAPLPEPKTIRTPEAVATETSPTQNAFRRQLYAKWQQQFPNIELLKKALQASRSKAMNLEFPPLPEPPGKELKWGPEFKKSHPVLLHEYSERSALNGINEAKKHSPAELAKMVPHQVPGYGCDCPHCGHQIKGQGQYIFKWTPERPEEMACMKCATVFPNKEYPLSKSKKFLSPFGDNVTLHYYTDDKGKDYYLDGQLDSLKHKWLMNIVRDFSQAYAMKKDKACGIATIAILQGYANSLPKWLIRSERHKGYLSTGGPFMRDGKPDRHASMPFPWTSTRWDRGYWWFSSYPQDLLKAYDLLYQHPYWDSKQGTNGRSLRFAIEQDIFGNQSRYLLMYPWKAQINNNLAGQIGHLVAGAKVMGRPDYARFAASWCRLLLYHYISGHDMMTPEGPGYHSTWLTSIRGNYRILAGYEDPPGYRDAQGKHMKAWDPRNYPAKQRQALAHRMLAYPDGSRFPIGDAHRFGKNGAASGSFMWQQPLRETSARIAPGFGTSILGAGRGDWKTHTQATLTWSGGNHSHCHEDALSLLLFAHGHELFSDTGSFWDAHGTYHHNCLAIDRTIHNNPIHKDIEVPAGDLEWFTPHWQGIQLTRVDGRACSYPEKASRYRRTLALNTIEKEHPYVLDIFEAEGGTLHEYFLQGSLEKDEQNPEHIRHRQTGRCSLTGLKPFTDVPKEWKGFKNLMATSMNTDGYVDFRFTDAPEIGTRTFFQKDTSTQLVLGEMVNFRYGKIGYGSNNLDEMPKEALTPKLILRREGNKKDLSSVFVLLHEAVNGNSTVRRFKHQLSPEGILSIAVEMADGRKDYYAIDLGSTGNLKAGPLIAKGAFAAATLKDGKCDLWMHEATQASCMNRNLKLPTASWNGSISRVVRRETGAPFDAFLTNAELPEDIPWKGEMVLVEFFDAKGKFLFNLSSEIEAIVPDGNQRWVCIRQDAGIVRTPNGEWQELFSPHRKAASCRLKILSSASTVPDTILSRNKGPWRPEWVNDFIPLPDGEKIGILTSRADAPIHVSGAISAQGTGQVQLELPRIDNLLSIALDNPQGVVVPAPKEVRYLNPLKSKTVSGLKPGLVWTLFKGRFDREPDNLRKIDSKVVPTVAPQLKMSRNQTSRFEGHIKIPASGLYSFYSRAEGSASLKIGEIEVIRAISPIEDDLEWEAQIYLEKGTHRFLYDYGYIRWSDTLFSLKWKPPGKQIESIPTQYLLYKR